METITVGYSRKASQNFDSFGVNASVEFKPTSEDMQKEIDQALLALKLILDPRLEEFAGKSGGALEKPNEPDLGEPPEWVGQNQERVDELLGRGTVPPPPPPPRPQPTPSHALNVVGDVVAGQSDQSAPVSNRPINPVGGTIDGQDIYLEKAKVFRVNIKRSRTGKAYAELRVGHDDLAAYGFDEHYVTTRIFDPEYVAAVGTLTKMKNEETGQIVDLEQFIINKGDFVNLWGKFSVWTSDPSKFDINGDAIQKSQ